jgi:hypothetical protein
MAKANSITKSARTSRSPRHLITAARRHEQQPLAAAHIPRLDQLAITAGNIVTEWMDVDNAKLADLLEPIEDEAPRHKAATPRAALFQLLLAVGDLHEIDDTHDHDDEPLHARYKRIIQCVESALDFFEVDTDLNRSAIGGDYYSPRRQSRPTVTD